MRLYALVALGVGLLLGAAPRTDKNNLQGTWKVVGEERDGSARGEEALKKVAPVRLRGRHAHAASRR